MSVWIRRIGFAILLVGLGGICASCQVVPTHTAEQSPMASVASSKQMKSTPSATPTPITPSPRPPEATLARLSPPKTPTPNPEPSNTSSPVPASTSPPLLKITPAALSGGMLVVHGANDTPILTQVDVQGNTWPLGESSSLSDSFSASPHLSPDGEWLAYMEGIYAAEASERLTLYNLQTGETQTILVPVGGSGMVPIFDAASRRVAYTISADPALQINGLHAWGIYVRDITTGSDTLFGGPFLARPQDRPLASLPIAWVGEELVLDAYLPTSGEHNLGVWALDVTDAIPGETGFLEDYDRQVLSPQDVLPWFYRHPSVSPPGSVLAFFLYDYGHQPSCLDANRYEEGSTVALGVVPTTGGEPRVLVDVSSSDSMLASPLTWSPDGQRILFAQGQCQDMSTSFGWTLRIVDLRGNIAGEWSLEPVETVWWGAALWCSPDDIFYTRQRGGLWHLSLATGGSERVLSGGVRLAGCLP